MPVIQEVFLQLGMVPLSTCTWPRCDQITTILSGGYPITLLCNHPILPRCPDSDKLCHLLYRAGIDAALLLPNSIVVLSLCCDLRSRLNMHRWCSILQSSAALGVAILSVSLFSPACSSKPSLIAETLWLLL